MKNLYSSSSSTPFEAAINQDETWEEEDDVREYYTTLIGQNLYNTPAHKRRRKPYEDLRHEKQTSPSWFANVCKLFPPPLHHLIRQRHQQLLSHSHSPQPNISDQLPMIPQDLQFQILLRLPVKSLLRCRSVCKSWLSHIDSSRFISHHARHIHTSDNQLVVMHDRTGYEPTDWDYTAFCFTFVSIHDLCLFEYIELAQKGMLPLCAKSLVSSFDGVICLVGRGEDVVLWNPAALEMNVLPLRMLQSLSDTKEDEDDDEDSGPTDIQYSFGLDVENNDYKVVKVAVKYFCLTKEFRSNVEVYSLSMGHWRAIDTVMPLKFRMASDPGKQFRNGQIYCWLGSDCHSKSRGYSILSFNFSSEAFVIIPGPELYTNYSYVYTILTFFRKKIACVHTVTDDPKKVCGQFDIWVLDEYGAKESWTKLYTIKLNQLCQPLGFSTDGKLVFLKGEDRPRLHLVDPCTQEANAVLTPWNISQVVMYKESLISVKSANGVTNRVAPEAFVLG